MDLSVLSKTELLLKCEELGIIKCKSKNKNSLIEMINKQYNNTEINTEINAEINTADIKPEQTIINNNVSYFNIDILKFNTQIKFDLIYLDPPYETNRNFAISKIDNTGFNDTWDNDDYAKWINNLIIHLNTMLSNVGTLVFHISADNSFIVESILRTHFKKISKIHWRRCHGKNTVKNKLGEVMDIIFVCGEGIFNMQYIPMDENSVWAFKNKDDVGEYSLGALKHDKTRNGYKYAIEKDGVIYENEWKQKKEIVEGLIAENRIHFAVKQKNMYVKIYKHEHKGVALSNLWTDIHSITRTTSDPRLYPTQKPQKLLERIIKLYSNEGSYVLDPVCGSGTTGFVADKLGRKSIICDINADTLNIIKKRFEDKVYNI
jgi:adenine-specific DNA-methyltransferase